MSGVLVDTTPEASQVASADNTLSCVLSVNEIRMALNLVKTGQPPGEDGISAELLKLGGESSVVAVPPGFFPVGV